MESFLLNPLVLKMRTAVVAVALTCLSTAGFASDPILAGGIALEGPVAGAGILLQSEYPATLQGRVINVFRKTGDASSFNGNVFVGQIRAQTDPRTIEALLRRSANQLSDDPEALLSDINEAVYQLFQDVDISSTGLSLGEMLSVMIAYSETDLQQREDLLFLAKRFPGVGEVAGMAFFEEVAFEVTYELRLCPERLDGPDDGNVVIGRVTVDPAVNFVPAAPGQPQVLGVQDARGDLNVRLRWATPQGYGSAGPLVFGYNVYRIPEALGQSAWETTPPTRAELETALGLEAGELDQSMYRINSTPILPPQSFSEAEADASALEALLAQRYGYPPNWSTLSYSDIDDPAELVPEVNAAPATRERRIELEEQIKALQSDFSYIDENERWFGGQPFTKASGYYYAVAARNAFGTAGELSPFKLVRIPSYALTDTPQNLRTENVFNYDNSSDSTSQTLALRWDALRDEAGDVREDVFYYVYRWNAATEMLAYSQRPFLTGIETSLADEAAYFGGEAPLRAGLVAGPSDLGAPDADGVFSFTDAAVDSAYEGLTFFYTVRAAAADGSGSGVGGQGAPVFSPHSVPVWGVLRDRTGPEPATGLLVELPCLTVDVICHDNSISDYDASFEIPLPAGRHLLRMTCLPDDDAGLANSLQKAWFRIDYSKNSVLNGGVGEAFLAGSDNFVDGFPATYSAEIDTPETLTVGCKIMLKNGAVSDWVDCSIPLGALQSPSGLIDVVFKANITYDEQSSDCGFYFPFDPLGDFKPPVIRFFPGEDTWAYNIYRRVDDGHDELLTTFELSDDSLSPLDTATAITYEDSNIPAYASRLCYYLETFDENGNPGARQLIRCENVAQGRLPLPVPAITEVVPGGTDAATAHFELSWFCAPAGVERFAVLVTDADTGVPVSTLVSEAIFTPEGVSEEWSAETIEDQNYWRYATVRTDSYVDGVEASPAEPATVDSALFTAVITEGIQPGREYRFRVQALGPAFPLDNGDITHLDSDPSEALDVMWRPEVPTSSGPDGPDVNWPIRAIEDAADLPNPHIRPVLIDTLGEIDWENFAGVGVEVGRILVDTQIDHPTVQPGLPKRPAPNFPLPRTVNLGEVFFNLGAYEPERDSVLPCLLFRMEVDPDTANPGNNNTAQPVSGDLIQCSPVIAKGTIAYDPDDGSGTRAFRDPFLFVGRTEDLVAPFYYPVYILDTQPVIRGATYRYFMATLDERQDVENVWDIGLIAIPE